MKMIASCVVQQLIACLYLLKDAQKFRAAFDDAKKIMTKRLQNDSTGMIVVVDCYHGQCDNLIILGATQSLHHLCMLGCIYRLV